MDWTKWIPTKDTKLAKEVHPKTAGILFSAAGFQRAHLYDGEKKRQYRCVEIAAKDLSRQEVESLIVWKDAGAEVPTKKEEKPSYEELTETLEHLNRLVEELRQENCQLRQHLASANSNGLGERARKALAGAKRTLELYKD